MIDKRKGNERIHQALRGYVDLGLPVIPLCAHDHAGYSERHTTTCKQPGKIPVIKGWREHDTTTLEQVKAWIREFRNINIGLPLGKVSGYVGIDIDGEFGEDMLEELSNGDIPDTWEFTTGSGRRLLYAIPVGMETKKFVNINKDGEHEECSILCDGQQTVLPPSIHSTGRIYEWIEGHSPDDMDCEMAPRWLLDLIRVDGPGSRGRSKVATPNPLPIDEPADGIEVAPLLVTDNTLPAEFSDFVSLEMDTAPPDTNYIGAKAKEQEREEDRLSPTELMQKITSGNRDNQMTRIIGSFCAQFRQAGKDYIMLMAKNHNQMFCDPPLDDFAIEAKVNHFWELEQMKSSKFKEMAGSGEKARRFAPGEIAQVAINLLETGGYCLKVDDEHPIIWMTKKSEGPWYPIDSRGGKFNTYLKEPLGNPEVGGDSAWTTVRHYKDAANAVVVELRSQNRIWETNDTEKDTQSINDFQFIPLAGGKLLDWRTGEVKPWDPDTNLTYTLPVEYDPQAICPSWERRLTEWLPEEGSRLILQEFIGYSLIPYMGFEKALVIQGEGANGKSIFLEVIQGLLGYKVVDSINMRNLFSRFGQAGLVGKILNIVNEAGSDYLRGSHADDFKNLVSGGRIQADVKNLAPITFNNTAKFIFASNHDIKTGDKSEGWLRRLLIVPFEQDFKDSKVPKYEIMNELRAEYPGIFNWAIEGLRRLMKQQQFSESEAARRKKETYVQDNDITSDFYMNCLETFDLAEMNPEGKPVRSGTPSSLINYLFNLWIEYRESNVQKKNEKITKFLQQKKRLSKARTTHTLLVKKVMTECWIGLKVNIRDANFLEIILQEPISKYPELKQYAETRLSEIDGMAEKSLSSTPDVTNFPDTHAQ